MTDLRDSIAQSIQSLAARPLRDHAIEFLKTLGYESDRTVDLGSSKPDTFLDFVKQNSADGVFNPSKALFDDWKSADLLFQLTDSELSPQKGLFNENDVAPSLLRSYLFFAIELTGENYARGKLTDIARQINRVFPMPVMVLIKHKAAKQSVLSVAVINRRQNKIDASKDVLGKVTIIRDISIDDPHRGHLDILASFALETLREQSREPIETFDALHTAWEKIFNVELLNERFYQELANWYFWALPQVEFPDDIEKDKEKRNATSLIRLLTRLIFCWFLKEKGLIPGRLFDPHELKKLLVDLNPDSYTFHQGILQNLFFGTLNQQMGTNPKTKKPYRQFAKDEGFKKNLSTYDVNNLYRYEALFHDPEQAIEQFADIPFLNGGLFECLDRSEEKTNKKLYIDGFSRNHKKRPKVPNHLFFSEPISGVDLSDAYGVRSRRNETVRGLIRILNGYKFTIVENTPIDQEIALDPELLGKVFENLLASYNEETKTTARKQTGSFYTPRPIVEYMVDESLKAHLRTSLVASGMKEQAAIDGLQTLFAYTEEPHPFDESKTDTLLEAIHTCKILDPACGSGAFPMGMLQKLVYIIHRLDPGNEKWMQLQIDKASEILDSSARDAAIRAIEKDFAGNADDYGRKLYLIENCLYGVDIQPIAIQISKLRFFISLICDQRTTRSKKDNHGVRPLPNLETKFVSANTLVKLKKNVQLELFESKKIQTLEKELRRIRHDHFASTTRQQKQALQNRDREIRLQMSKELEQTAFWDQDAAFKLAVWDPYDPQATADFFEPLWMFDRTCSDGFSIVIGNPPYIDSEGMTRTQPHTRQFVSDTYSLTRGNWDIYIAFFEQGFNFLTREGFLTYITPDKWISKPFGNELRLQFTDKIRSLLHAGRNVFEAVNVDAIVTLFGSVPTKELRIDEVVESGFQVKYIANKASLKPPYAYDWLFSDRLDFLQAVESAELTLASFGLCENSCATSDAYKLKEFVVDGDEEPHSGQFKIINTGTIGKYVSKWGLREMVYLGGRYLRPVVDRESFLDSFQNTYGAKSVQPKIIIKGLNLLDGCLDETGDTIPGKTTLVVTAETKSNLKLLLAILNSSVALLYLREKYPASSYNTGTTFTKAMLNELPVPKLTQKDIDKLIGLVNRRLAIGRDSDDPEAAELESKIDQTVKELYGVAGMMCSEGN